MNETVQEPLLSLTEEAICHLDVIRKWTMFLAILGFIGSGFLVLFGFFFALVLRTFGRSNEFGPIVPALLGVLYVVLGGAYSVPSYFLLRFSSNAKSALATKGNEPLTSALKYLRSFFVFIGVAIVAIIVLYIVIVAGAIAFGILGAMRGAAQS